jgi:adenylate kinase
MRRLLLFGAPGSGKGTMGDFIQRDYHLVKISTGDILRSAIQQGTPAGLQAKSIMDSGRLVPDALVSDMLRQRLDRGGLNDGYILDGYPRTLVQAEALSSIAVDSEQAVFIEVSEAEAVQRLLGRLTCSACGAIYNRLTKPPQRQGRCDLCGGRVDARDDDSERAVRQRFQVYVESTMPVIEFYAARQLLARVDGAGAAEAVYKRIRGLLS